MKIEIGDTIRFRSSTDCVYIIVNDDGIRLNLLCIGHYDISHIAQCISHHKSLVSDSIYWEIL